MPVQVLPPVQSFGSKLSEALGDAAVSYFEGKQKKSIEQKDQKILQDLQNPDLTPLQQMSLAAGLSKDKFSALSPILSAYTKSKGVESNRAATQDFITNLLNGAGNNQTQTAMVDPQTPLMAAMAATQGGSMIGEGQGGQPIPGMNQGVIPPAQPSPSNIRVPTDKEILAAYLADPSGKASSLLQNQRTAGLQQQQQEKKAAFEKEKFEQKKNIENQRERLSIHKESAKYAEGLAEAKKRAENQKAASHSVRQALAKGKTGTFTWQNFFKKQFKGTFLENIALTPEGAIVESSIPVFLEGGRELFGQRLSDADLGVILGKTVDLGKSKEVNEAILSFAEKTADLILKKAEIAKQIVKENGGYRPIGFENMVEDLFQEKYGRDIDNAFRESFGAKSTDVQMKDSEGNDLWVPQEDVQMLIDKGLATPA